MARQHPTTFLPMAAGYPSLMGHHRHLLDDAVRTRAFVAAVREVVRRGARVLDVGTGTGVLAMAARRAGASVVYAIDHDPIVWLARDIARDNHIDGIEWRQCAAADLELPEQVDVIVSECFGVLAVGGTMLRAVCALRDRVLAPGGSVIPARVRVCAAPVSAPADHAVVAAWSRRRYGLDLRAAGALAQNQPYNTLVAARQLLARGAVLAEVDVAGRGAFDGAIAGRATFETRRAGTLHGIATWFDADLGGGVTLRTGPGAPSTIWRQVYFPIAPVRVRRGETIAVALRGGAGARDTLGFAWTVTACGAAQDFTTARSWPRRAE